MVDENKQLASKIDSEIQNAHEQVNNLRDELTETNKRLEDHINSKLEGVSSEKISENGLPLSAIDKNLENHADVSLFSRKDAQDVQDDNTKKSNTNPFSENFASASTTKNNHNNFFGNKKIGDYFGSPDSSNKNNNDEGKEKLEFFGNSDKLFEDFEKKNNFFTDCITSKIFKGTEEAIKPEDFVLTSESKLNFLTKPSDGRKNTGAVPKRNKASSNEHTGKSNEITDGKADLEKSSKVENKNTSHFVRPNSPLSSKQGE